MPSAASCVRIRSSKYSRSSSGSVVRARGAASVRAAARRVAKRRSGLAGAGASRTSRPRHCEMRPRRPPASMSPPACHSAAGRGSPVTIARSLSRRRCERQQRRGRRRKHPERDFRQPEHRVVGREDEIAGEGQLESAAQTAAAHHRRRGAGSDSRSWTSAAHRGRARPISSGVCSGMLAPKLKSAPRPSIVTSFRCGFPARSRAPIASAWMISTVTMLPFG